MPQQRLWFDRFEDALKDVLIAVYGGKGWAQKAAVDLWGEVDPITKGNYLEHALNPERNEKLSPAEILWILKKGRAHGCHTAMSFLGDECSYRFEVVSPEDEKARLQREFIEAADQLRDIEQRIRRYEV